MTDAGRSATVWRTDRLRVTELRPEHAGQLFAVLDDPRVGTYLGGAVAESAAALADRIRRQAAGPPPGVVTLVTGNGRAVSSESKI